MRADPGDEPPFTSSWFVMDEGRINAFAHVTEDHQPIHLDDAAGRAAGFGGSIACGFLTLSMLSAMGVDAMAAASHATHINYGFDRVRFLAPVPKGARVRGHFCLAAQEWQSSAICHRHYDVRVEVEGEARPALVARWIIRSVLRQPS
ncbi:MAG: MaoC/PaaZ C-terminal domain-containing protein [Pseudomonadota bacterium]